MAIAITEDHQALGATVADLADKRQLLEANRSLLEATEENLPAAWDEIAKLGWLGLHVPEAYGGSGFGLEELVVVVEELARKVAPGPFVPTVIASAAIAAALVAIAAAVFFFTRSPKVQEDPFAKYFNSFCS